MHAGINHVFIVVDGEAEFITGGKLIDPKVIGESDGRKALIPDRCQGIFCGGIRNNLKCQG
jgi:hypothetical protein